MNRDIKEVFCSCGGKVTQAETTDGEEKKHGCSRRDCCVVAWTCDRCGTRWTFALDPPEPRYDD